MINSADMHNIDRIGSDEPFNQQVGILGNFHNLYDKNVRRPLTSDNFFDLLLRQIKPWLGNINTGARLVRLMSSITAGWRSRALRRWILGRRSDRNVWLPGPTAAWAVPRKLSFSMWIIACCSRIAECMLVRCRSASLEDTL